MQSHQRVTCGANSMWDYATKYRSRASFIPAMPSTNHRIRIVRSRFSSSGIHTGKCSRLSEFQRRRFIRKDRVQNSLINPGLFSALVIHAEGFPLLVDSPSQRFHSRLVPGDPVAYP